LKAQKPDHANSATIYYAWVAREQGCAFLDAGSVIVSSELDGIHFEADEHRKLGLAVAEQVRALLK
jgi:hypothetical protein